MRYKRNFLNWVQHFQFHSITVITGLSYLYIMFQYSLIPRDKVCKMYFFTFPLISSKRHTVRVRSTNSDSHVLILDMFFFFISKIFLSYTAVEKPRRQILKFVSLFMCSVRNHGFRKVLHFFTLVGLYWANLPMGCHNCLLCTFL